MTRLPRVAPLDGSRAGTLWSDKQAKLEGCGAPGARVGCRTDQGARVPPAPAERFRQLVDQDVLASLEASTVDVADARYWPGWMYSSEEWFEYEKAAVYDRSWLCVGRADFLKRPGDYYTVTINDEPLIVVMGDDGVIRVLSSGVPAPRSPAYRGAGVCRVGIVPLPAPLLVLRPARSAQARAGDAPDEQLRPRRRLPAAIEGRALAGLRVRALRPRCRTARADARDTSRPR